MKSSFELIIRYHLQTDGIPAAEYTEMFGWLLSIKYILTIGEPMPYDSEKDEYTCQNGKKLKAVYIGTHKLKSGFESEITYYEFESFEGCIHKKSCTRAKGIKKLL